MSFHESQLETVRHHDGFVVVREALKNILILVLMILWFAKQRELIESGSKPLKVLMNCLGSLGPLAELLLELADVTAAGLHIRGGESLPDLRRGGGRRG